MAASLNADSSIWESRKAALFDMDGTLMDSMWMWTDIDIEYLKRIPQAEGTDVKKLQQAIEGMAMREIAVWFRSTFHMTDSIEKMQADWNEMALLRYQTRVPLKPGAREMLQQMKKQGKKLGICTSNSMELAEAAMKANKVEGMFDVVLSSGDVGRGKPNPDIYLEGARRVGARPEDVIVFEDVLNGVLAGKRAGMKVCGVADADYADKRQLIIDHADYFVEDFRQLLR